MARPVILVDLDGVVYDWIRSMARWLFKNNAIKYDEDFAVSKYSQWAVWDDWNIPKGEFIRWWRLGVEAEEIYAKGPLIEGARNALWRLSDSEWDIHIATSRLTKFGLHDKIVENTSSWLRDNNIPYRQLSFTNQKTFMIAAAIVDDRADNMSTKVHGVTFEFAAPHNDSDVGWDDILRTLL